jgi:hypothetical protein
MNHDDHQDKDRGIRILARLGDHSFDGRGQHREAAAEGARKNEFVIADKNAAKPAIAPLLMK